MTQPANWPMGPRPTYGELMKAVSNMHVELTSEQWDNIREDDLHEFGLKTQQVAMWVHTVLMHPNWKRGGHQMTVRQKITIRELIPNVDDGEDHWWWFSFAGDEGFRGGANIQAPSLEDALAKSWLLGINPGGEIAVAGPMDNTTFTSVTPENLRHRLLQKEEIPDAVEWPE